MKAYMSMHICHRRKTQTHGHHVTLDLAMGHSSCEWEGEKKRECLCSLEYVGWAAAKVLYCHLEYQVLEIHARDPSSCSLKWDLHLWNMISCLGMARSATCSAL